jgi:mycofactocin biosynthetic radical S-adenosylmethionine protein MftC
VNFELMSHGLSAPICLTWELTYACNLRCRHCLSSSGRAASNELSTSQAFVVIDQMIEMQVFYANVGGGEPLGRPDFRDIVEHAVGRGLGMKVSTNGTLVDDSMAQWISETPYLDIQISIDGTSAEINDRIRGRGSFDSALRAMDRLADRGFRFTLNSVVTRANIDDLDELQGIAASRGAELRLSRLRPSGRGARVWQSLHPTASQNARLY